MCLGTSQDPHAFFRTTIWSSDRRAILLDESVRFSCDFSRTKSVSEERSVNREVLRFFQGTLRSPQKHLMIIWYQVGKLNQHVYDLRVLLCKCVGSVCHLQSSSVTIYYEYFCTRIRSNSLRSAGFLPNSLAAHIGQTALCVLKLLQVSCCSRRQRGYCVTSMKYDGCFDTVTVARAGPSVEI